jgi:hypothetical protein
VPTEKQKQIASRMRQFFIEIRNHFVINLSEFNLLLQASRTELIKAAAATAALCNQSRG